MSRISFIVAVAEDGAMGRDNQLPWHLPDDMRFFKRMTMGKPVIMGRKTFESIGKPLPGRRNIVLTRDLDYRAAGCTVVHSVLAALEAAGDVPEIMIGGGAEIYRLFLPEADRIYLTRVMTTVPDSDTFFPALNEEAWQEVSREYHPADERHPFPFYWCILDRV